VILEKEKEIEKEKENLENLKDKETETANN
jgi:hypothetical protein